MKLVINYIEHIAVFLNGRKIEPIQSKEKKDYYVIPDEETPTEITIIHYDEPRALKAYTEPTTLRAIRNCLSEGFEQHCCSLQIVSTNRLPRKLEFDVQESSVTSGFLTYIISHFSLIQEQCLSGLEIKQTRFSSEKEKRWSLIIPIIKWIFVLTLLIWFDISWASEILYHEESAEIFTNLLSPLHLFATIPLLTISVFAVCTFDIRGILLQRKRFDSLVAPGARTSP